MMLLCCSVCSVLRVTYNKWYKVCPGTSLDGAPCQGERPPLRTCEPQYGKNASAHQCCCFVGVAANTTRDLQATLRHNHMHGSSPHTHTQVMQIILCTPKSSAKQFTHASARCIHTLPGKAGHLTKHRDTCRRPVGLGPSGVAQAQTSKWHQTKPLNTGERCYAAGCARRKLSALGARCTNANSTRLPAQQQTLRHEQSLPCCKQQSDTVSSCNVPLLLCICPAPLHSPLRCSTHTKQTPVPQPTYAPSTPCTSTGASTTAKTCVADRSSTGTCSTRCTHSVGRESAGVKQAA